MAHLIEPRAHCKGNYSRFLIIWCCVLCVRSSVSEYYKIIGIRCQSDNTIKWPLHLTPHFWRSTDFILSGTVSRKRWLTLSNSRNAQLIFIERDRKAGTLTPSATATNDSQPKTSASYLRRPQRKYSQRQLGPLTYAPRRQRAPSLPVSTLLRTTNKALRRCT